MLGSFCLLKEDLSAEKQKSFIIYQNILKILYLFYHQAIVLIPHLLPIL